MWQINPEVAQKWPTVTLQFDKADHLGSCHCFMKAEDAGSYRRITLRFQSQCAGKSYTMGSKALSFLFTRFSVGEVNTTDWFREVSPSAYFNHKPINCLRNILWRFHLMPVYQTLTCCYCEWERFLIGNVFTAWNLLGCLLQLLHYRKTLNLQQALQKHPRLSIEFLWKALRRIATVTSHYDLELYIKHQIFFWLLWCTAVTFSMSRDG